MAGSYLIGNAVAIDARFYVDDALADPTAITLRLIAPDGTETPYTYSAGGGVIVRDGVGLYRAIIFPSMPGHWRYRWTGAGAVVAAGEGSFAIEPTAFSA